MPRLMSVALTEDAVIARTKTVTRRLGWRFLWPGDRIQLTGKVMGRRKGDPLERYALVEIVDVRREPLRAITADDIDREGVNTHMTPTEWVAWFCENMKCTPDTEITRIEWRYLQPAEVPPEAA